MRRVSRAGFRDATGYFAIPVIAAMAKPMPTTMAMTPTARMALALQPGPTGSPSSFLVLVMSSGGPRNRFRLGAGMFRRAEQPWPG